MSSLGERRANIGMSWKADVSPFVVVDPEHETELEDDTNFHSWRSVFEESPFSECLYSDMNYMCRRKTNSTIKDAVWTGPNVFNVFQRYCSTGLSAT